MDELDLVKKRRVAEQQSGDVRRACERAGVSAPIFQSAIKKTLIDELSDKEMAVLRAFLAILDERKAEKEALKRSFAGK